MSTGSQCPSGAHSRVWASPGGERPSRTVYGRLSSIVSVGPGREEWRLARSRCVLIAFEETWMSTSPRGGCEVQRRRAPQGSISCIIPARFALRIFPRNGAFLPGPVVPQR